MNLEIKINKKDCKNVVVYYDKSEKLKKEFGLYCKGKKEGQWVELYKNGKIKWKGNFNSGERNIKLDKSQKTIISFDGNLEMGISTSIIISSKGIPNNLIIAE